MHPNRTALFIAIFGIIISIGLIRAVEPRSRVSAAPGPQRLNTAQLIEAARDRGEIDRETAYLYLAFALTEHDRLPERFRSDVPWDGTLPMRDLLAALPSFPDGRARETIESLVSDNCGGTGNLPDFTYSTYFYIEYGPINSSLTLQNYADSLDTAWETQVNSFGWAAPPLLLDPPRYHVRIANLGSGLYGFVTTSGTYAGFVGDNPNTTWNDVDAYASCMVLNNDYSAFPGSPQTALDATTAHEFNHSIQFGYGALTGWNAPDNSFIEGGATWMEDEVFDDANDNYNYLWPSFNQCMGEYPVSPYPYWITFRGMLERYGTGAPNGGEQVFQDFWESISRNESAGMAAFNTALNSQGASLADAYHNYAIAVKFNRACSGGYAYPYCLDEGAGYVALRGPTPLIASIDTADEEYTGSLQNNYALNWVGLPVGSDPYTITLSNNSSGGVIRGSVACDTGSGLTVLPFSNIVGAGESTTLTGFNPDGCVEVVAVLTNQEQTGADTSSCAASGYTLSLDGAGPAPSTPTPTVTEMPSATSTPTPVLLPTSSPAPARIFLPLVRN